MLTSRRLLLEVLGQVRLVCLGKSPALGMQGEPVALVVASGGTASVDGSGETG